MKKLIALFSVILLVSCVPVRTTQDYAVGTDFSKYMTYAYFKQGIDQAEASQLDKKRILRAIDAEMQRRGFTKSETPDIMVSFFTDAEERVDVYNNVGFGWGGWGWGGFGWGWGNNVNRTTEGILYIDFIDGNTKDLVWQGVGRAALRTRPEDKVERTNEMVVEILEQFPPQERR